MSFETDYRIRMAEEERIRKEKEAKAVRLMDQIKNDLPTNLVAITFRDPTDSNIEWTISHEDEPGLTRNAHVRKVTRSAPEGTPPLQSLDISKKFSPTGVGPIRSSEGLMQTSNPFTPPEKLIADVLDAHRRYQASILPERELR